MADFAGKVVLVTGGTRGIGLELVRAFAAAGAIVAFAGKASETVEEGRRRLSSSPGVADRLHGFVAELADAAAPRRLVDEVVAACGGIDVLVCNAGLVGSNDLWALEPEEWDRIVAVNLRAAFFCAREAAVSMRARGGGNIVNIASVAGQIGGAATGPAYVASKAGMIGLTKSLARHFAASHIRVNCVAPADIETDMTAGWPEELRQRLKAMTPLARFGHVGEVSRAVMYLAGEGASFVTGHTLNVNGGIYMG
ncbi:SDR family NAD(P)-dependent oxidoreductase [Reyranella soli]|uniref:Beta-ketoacyl-ACP reductase n=1 Tax=Reyranella soli TaxID=1230389 RepID=A0A512NDE2_9HYPH|nr:SDR family oxidoreductase [Reyranella soli]GEP56966.1 beta-ketoacyl-ACP reductase [Reyranella soli]